MSRKGFEKALPLMQFLENIFSAISDHSKRGGKSATHNFHSGGENLCLLSMSGIKTWNNLQNRYYTFVDIAFVCLCPFSACRKLIKKIIMRSTISCQLHEQNFGMFLPA